MIPFNDAINLGGKELVHLEKVIESNILAGDGPYTQLVHQWFNQKLPKSKVLMTPSCTAALEMAALLIDIQPEDEVIMPSYTFVSTANAFALRGAKIVFVDIDPRTMNIDPACIKAAISDKTKAIVPVHYGGVSCDMETIMDIADKYNLFVIEDAAQAMMSTYNDKPVGVYGHIATYSFHETKNYTSGGEGGLLILNEASLFERAEVIREKGTNRSKFFRGQVDKYTWVDIGSSYLPGELQAAHLYSQLLCADDILNKRLRLWNIYFESLKPLEERGLVDLVGIPEECKHNGHLFYVKCKSLTARKELIETLGHAGVMAVFHYVPLHSSPAAKKFSRFSGKDLYTTKDSERLVRLPIFYNLSEEQAHYIVDVAVKLLTNKEK